MAYCGRFDCGQLVRVCRGQLVILAGSLAIVSRGRSTGDCGRYNVPLWAIVPVDCVIVASERVIVGAWPRLQHEVLI